MSEQKQNIRPTKKQQELLAFIAAFIDENGYSPSYREIMAGCNYTSVATVSLHVNNLIKRGHIIKREHSARSLEVINPVLQPANGNEPGEENTHVAWLRQELLGRLEAAEREPETAPGAAGEAVVLLAALRIFVPTDDVTEFEARLRAAMAVPEEERAT